MKNNYSLEEIYILCEKTINNLNSNKSTSEEQLLKIIRLLSFEEVFIIYKKNNYNLDEISKLFNFHIEQLRSSFHKDKTDFYLRFKAYLLIIDSFTKLCLNFSTNKEKRVFIKNILQILKESKNILKLYIPFEDKEIKILNNLIGQQLYYYTHINEIEIKKKHINRIFEEYYYNLEKMIHGYELSHESNFGNTNKSFEEVEKMIFLNNASFLLLKMIHKINYSLIGKEFDNNPYFLKIVEQFCSYFKLNKNKKSRSFLEFEEILIEEFKKSIKKLNNNNKINILNEKIELLRVDTDEYKQLIDIMLDSKV